MKMKTLFKKLKIGHYSTWEKKSFPFVYLMLLFPVAQLIVFWFYVNVSSIALAFTGENGFTFEHIGNVIKSFASGVDYADRTLDPMLMLKNSVSLWLNIHGVAFIISIFTSYMLTKHMVGSKIFRLIYQIPVLVGAVVFSGIMRSLYEAGGPILDVFKTLGLYDSLPKFAQSDGLLGTRDTAFDTLMVQAFVLTISGGSMIIAGAYMKIPEEIFESAKLEGCGFFREAFQIAIPCIWPTLSTLVVFSLTSFFVSDYNFYLYSDGTGRNGIVSIGFRLYKFTTTMAQYNGEVGDLYNYASAFGMFITLITLPLVLFGRWLLSKMNDDVEF